MKNTLPGFFCVCAVFLVCIPVNGYSQKPGITFGGSVLLSNPKGTFNNAYNFGGGVEVFGGIGSGNTFLIGTLGFSAFAAEAEGSGTLTYKPVKLGIRRFFLKKRLFINGDLGVALVKNKLMNEGRFTRGIGIGARLLGLELGLYYDGWKNKKAPGFSNFADLKVGWSFNL